jgi:NADPH2:quinone reductase
MRAIRVHELGDASKLKVEDLPLPEPKAGEVRVKVAAAGLNFTDIYSRKGWYGAGPLPFTPGAEFAGVVDAVGDGVTDFQPGERVGTASGVGGYAEYALARAVSLVPLPEAISFEQAAAVLLQGFTAHYLAFSTFPLKSGDTALVHAAAGGVGQLLVQIAKKCGARVIATVSTDEKIPLAKSSGADEVIQYSREDFVAETRRLTGGHGVDVVYDGVGLTTFTGGLDCLRPRGMMVLYGQASGRVEPLDPQVLNRKGSLFLTRPSLAHYLLTRQEMMMRAQNLFEWMAAGELKVTIDQRFPLTQSAMAHAYMEERRTKGKVLLIP